MLTKESECTTTCDGCGRSILANESCLGSIESCCGGCYRHLCRECVLHAAALMEETMSDEPRNEDERVTREIEESHEEVGRCDLGQVGDVEMTLDQWVETLPPGHGARRELLALRGESEELVTVRAQRDHYAAQLARLPHGRDDLAEASVARVDAIFKRVGDAEGALSALVDLIWDSGDTRMTVHQAYQAARWLLERRPSGMGGTAYGVSR